MWQPGPNWDASRSRPGLMHGFLSNLCTAVTSCFYVFCCCWLIEDCCFGRRSLPGPSYGYGSMDPPPPDVGPQPHGLLGSIFGGPLDSSPPPPPDVGPRYKHQHYGPPGQQSQPGPFGYPGEPY